MHQSEISGHDTESGSALVEFALVAPLFYLIVFGLVYFGIIFAGYCCANYASQVGVRYAIVHGTNSSSPVSADSTAMKNMMAPLLWAAPSSGTVITPTWNPDDSVGSAVTVNVSVTYPVGIPYFSVGTIKIGATATGTVLF
jgi:Flp pilus assembly protein TadG